MSRQVNIWLLMIVGICAVSLLYGKGVLQRRPSESNRISDGEQEWASTNGASIQVVIMNGTHVSGLARDVGLKLGQAGLAPVGFGNARPQNYQRSFVVNRRLDRRIVERLSELLGGIPVVKEFDQRASEDVLVVLGQDHEAVLAALDDLEE